jgi:site-specific recombinase XerD
MDDQRISTTITSTFLEVVINGWIHENSTSPKTKKAYTDTLLQFRQWLEHEGLTLDNQSEEALVKISFLAQAYADHSKRGKHVAPATQNQRLAILSSFYDYAKGKRLVTVNPIDDVKREKVQAYAGARAIEAETTENAFLTIDQNTLQGKRDYALLSLALYTGRRVSEVSTLELHHLTMSKGKITVSFEHCKGEKQMRDKLPATVSIALLNWLHAFYGAALAIGTSQDTRPVFVSLANGGRNGKSYGKPLGTQAIADICQKYLGTSKAHAMRHTFAHTMEKAGASVSEIQAKLGHESLATTGRYLAQLGQDENKHGEKLAAMLGIK